MMDSPFTPKEKSIRWSAEDTNKLTELLKSKTNQYRNTNDIIAHYPQFAKYGTKRLGKKIVYLRTYKPHPLVYASKGNDGKQYQSPKGVAVLQQLKDIVLEQPKVARVKNGRTSIVSTPVKSGYAFTSSGNVKMNLMHMSHMWMNKDSHEFITIQLNLPSGVNIQEIDRVLQVNISDDGMNVIIVIDWPSVLTDSSIIQSGWERTNSTLTEDMKRQMFDAIDSNILLLKQRLRILSSENIKGECKIPLEKECLDEVIDMCVHHEETHGGLVLYITTKVRMLSKQATRKKIQVTSIPPSRVSLNSSNVDTTSTGIVTNNIGTTGAQQHSNPTTPIPHTLPVVVITDPPGSVVVPHQINDQHAEMTSVQESGIQTISGKKTKNRSDDTNSCTSNNEQVKRQRKETKTNSDRSMSSESSAVNKKAAETIPVSNKAIQNDDIPNSISLQQRHNKLPTVARPRTTTENTITDSNNGNDVDDDDDNGTTSSIRTDITDLVEGLLQVGQGKKT